MIRIELVVSTSCLAGLGLIVLLSRKLSVHLDSKTVMTLEMQVMRLRMSERLTRSGWLDSMRKVIM